MAKTISGTTAADTIIVTESDVTVNAGAGNDIITVAGGSRNVIHGDAGNDRITVESGAGADNTLYGDAGNDVINAKAGKNSVTIYGGDGADTLYGGSAADALYGGAGNDKLYGQSGDDTLTGGAGNDTFVHYASYGNDTITDYVAGEDVINIASGSISKTELLNNGKDVKYTISSGSVTVKNVSGKAVSLVDSRGSYTASKTAIVLGSDFTGEMDAGAYLATLTTINGQAATSNVTLKGNANANTVTGGSGKDNLYGNDGNDKLYGGDEKDTLYGQNGDDVLYGQNGNDKLYGGNGEDALYGQNGDDLLYGQNGDDVLVGGSGNDTLTGGAGNDTFVHYASYGNDTITDYAAGEDVINVASGSISKTELLNNGKDVKYTISSGSVTLTGGAGKTVSLVDSRGSYTASKTAITLGSDFSGTLDAGMYLPTVTTVNAQSATGAVILKGNGNANTILGGSGTDKFYGNGGKDYIDGGKGNDTLYGGAGNDTLLGSAGNDYLYGEADEDTLMGGGGNDYLSGGSGDDTLSGGSGNDTFYYTGGNDRITDYNQDEDKLEISTDYEITRVVADGDDVDLFLSSGESGSASVAGNITLEGADGEEVKITDSFGTYSLIASEDSGVVTLGPDFTGNLFVAYNGIGVIDATNATGADDELPILLVGNDEGNGFFTGSVAGKEFWVNGGSGDDVMYGGAGRNILAGNAGRDDIHGGSANDELYGGAGDDELYGGEGNDVLEGGAGDDYLHGGAGNDTLKGGEGDDTYYFGNMNNGTDTIFDNYRYDTVKFASSNMFTDNYTIDGSDVIYNYANNSTIIFNNGKERTVNFSFADTGGSATLTFN